MKVSYVGLRNENKGKKPQRGADVTCRYDDDERYTDWKDLALFRRTIQVLKIRGWRYTEMTPGWVFFELEDRAEYEDFLLEYKACKRMIQNCMKFGF